MNRLVSVVLLLSLVLLPVQAQSRQPTEIVRYGQGERNEFMSWSPDGARLAVGGRHGYWLYDTQDPNHPAEFVHTDSYTRPAYSPDGRLLVMRDRKIQVMDSAGELSWEIEGDIGAWSGDGTLIAVGNGRELSIWDAATRTLLHEHTMEASEEGRGSVFQFLFGANNQQVYFRYFISGVGAYWDVSYVWEPEADTVTVLDDYFPVLSGGCEHHTCFTPVAISSDGATLALLRIGGNTYFDEVIFLEPATGVQHVIHPERTPFREAASFSPDGTLFAVAENPRGISVWDTTTWEQRRLILDTGKPVFSPDSRYLATDHHVVDVRTGEVAWEITPAVRYTPSPDGRFMMELGMPPRVLDTVTGAEIAALQGVDSPVVVGVISPDGRWAATAHENLTAYLWDVSTGAPTEILQITEELRGETRMGPRSGPTFPAWWSLTFSPDSTLLAVSNNGAEVADRALVRDVLSGERYNLPGNIPFDVPIFSSTNLVILLQNDNGFERVAWEPRTDSLLQKSIFELVPRFAHLSHDGRLLALVGGNQIEVYEVATETLLTEISLPENPLGVTLRGFSANDLYLAYNVYFGETDPGTDYFWDVSRSEFVAPEDVTDVWFHWRSPNYGTISENTSEQSALMLYPSDATPDTPPIARLGGGAAWALFFTDESHVLAVYSDGVIVVWSLD